MTTNVSFVFPCLNEEATLARCIQSIHTVFRKHMRGAYEIVVADNGSTDLSVDIANAHGARVIHVKERGYGSALRRGILAAKGTHVVFADADMTYRLEEAYDLYRTAVDSGADLAIASRYGKRKGIESGAMPWLHRFVGTPTLTWLINRLFKGRVSDCNSGFRCVRRSAFQLWQTSASGMEFATEMIVKALKAKASIVEMPSGLRLGPKSRAPHLSTWRDGMRHLLLILAERPKVFESIGLGGVLIATILQVGGLIIGPLTIMGAHLFGVHTQALLVATGLLSSQIYLFSCAMYLHGKDSPGYLASKLIGLEEAPLLSLLVILGCAGFLMVVGVSVTWANSGFLISLLCRG